MSKKFMYSDAGQLLARKHAIEEIIDSLQEKFYSNDVSEVDSQMLLGKMDGITEAQTLSHSNVISAMVRCKKALNDMDASDYLDFERTYFQGYLDGLQTLADLNRCIFDMDFHFLIILFSEENDLLDKYELALQLQSDIGTLGSDKRVQFLIAHTISDIINGIGTLSGNDQYNIVVPYSDGKRPSVAMMNELAKHSSDCLCLCKDQDEIEVAAIVAKILKHTIID